MNYLVIMILLIGSYKANEQSAGSAQAGKPFVLGSINEIYSKQLAEKRILNIYLPAGYEQHDTTRYPVIYLLDGSADEDFIHVAGLLQFANFPWVKQFPTAILVGIGNVSRRRDFTFKPMDTALAAKYPEAGHSAAFMAFIEKELQPFIDSTYNTSSRKILCGQSLGGLLATEIITLKPSLFTDYIIISPSLWWDDEILLERLRNTGHYQPLKVFVAVGKEGHQMISDSRRLVSVLKRQNNQVSFQFFKHEDHASIMHLAMYEALKKMK